MHELSAHPRYGANYVELSVGSAINWAGDNDTHQAVILNYRPCLLGELTVRMMMHC